MFEYHEICLEGMWTDNKTMHRIIRMSWSWRPLRRSKWSLVSFNLFLYPLITVKNTWIKLQASTYVDGIILCYKYLLSISTMIRMMNNWKNSMKLAGVKHDWPQCLSNIVLYIENLLIASFQIITSTLLMPFGLSSYEFNLVCLR